MATIVIENLFQKTLEVRDTSKTLLYHLHTNGLDWPHACGAKGRCTTCKVRVMCGMDHISDPTAAEIKYHRQGLLHPDERLACQSVVTGDVCIRAPDESKLPHVTYSS
ncbi:2Fe-2S iron-sulfur cluster-binding protein [Chryseolinea lacunae]|uniref:(2Fe-2S)-binding protein n=1 Tax=Chryseolinea lacunae TaxID=2801331 RepID=A0ABS1KQF5_9BACT|nr:2Fe-2S iron-sulfur cluster-binding protein [Chryseolinea lacunae]MBL0741533.1 (2Fe-2S)-binding protein [Chryseolinea lacunae]